MVKLARKPDVHLRIKRKIQKDPSISLICVYSFVPGHSFISLGENQQMLKVPPNAHHRSNGIMAEVIQGILEGVSSFHCLATSGDSLHMSAWIVHLSSPS